jgi:hypothetical protein
MEKSKWGYRTGSYGALIKFNSRVAIGNERAGNDKNRVRKIF